MHLEAIIGNAQEKLGEVSVPFGDVNYWIEVSEAWSAIETPFRHAFILGQDTMVSILAGRSAKSKSIEQLREVATILARMDEDTLARIDADSAQELKCGLRMVLKVIWPLVKAEHEQLSERGGSQ